MNAAVFRNPDGGLVVGSGPFERLSSPPDNGVAFYRNDFALSCSQPWFVPSNIEILEDGEVPDFLKGALPEIAWEEPEVEPFAEVFAEVSQAIRSGSIEKSVPVATAGGRLRKGSCKGLGSALARRNGPLRPYGWVDGDEGVVGLSPELLFGLNGGVLHTMALAGTARVEEREAFGADEKEIREHEFVAQTLLAKLSDLGKTIRHPRDIMELGPLVHYHSAIDVELRKKESIDRLISLLHPTPALGPLPRTAETLGDLVSWRRRLGCPRWFGAPFGLLTNGSFEVLVAIRMIRWQGPQLEMPSGCGVIEESRLVNEWRELRLKRESVRGVFGV
ncbi:MAG TPA: hypothetical protein DD438_05090 [Verrucomicrobiales bacterium]|nr:hypothetical protein [Verrucomicrobiales bacterium]